MKRSKFIGVFDLDVTLRDAGVDPHNRPTRRMIANAAIGMDADDGYYAARELREAVEWVHEGIAGGKKKLSTILGNDCDDYQRCLYYGLAGRGVVGMLDDLMWLEEILEARGRTAGALRAARMRAQPLCDPYVARAPDGPIGRFDQEFEVGPSWWADPTLTG